MAKNDPAHIVAGAGLLTGIFTKLNAAVVALGGTEADLHRLTKPEGDAIIRAMAEQLVDSMVLTIDYDGPWFRELDRYLQDLPVAHLDLGHPLQEEFVHLGHPRPTGKADVRFEYVYLDPVDTLAEVLAKMDKQGLRRPNTAEAFSFFQARFEHPNIWLCGEYKGNQVAGFHSDGELIFPSWFSLNDQLLDNLDFLAVRK